MSHTFKIGEIAILQNGVKHPEFDGMEVEVVAIPQPFDQHWPGEPWYTGAGFYRVKLPFVRENGSPYLQSLPHQLRKRRPPQDWVKLCNLTDLPREVEHV